MNRLTISFFSNNEHLSKGVFAKWLITPRYWWYRQYCYCYQFNRGAWHLHREKDKASPQHIHSNFELAFDCINTCHLLSSISEPLTSVLYGPVTAMCTLLLRWSQSAVNFVTASDNYKRCIDIESCVCGDDSKKLNISACHIRTQ